MSRLCNVHISGSLATRILVVQDFNVKLVIAQLSCEDQL